MRHLPQGLGIAAALAVVSTLGVHSAASAQSNSAYVYVQVGGPTGAVYGYSASPGGQLSAIAGSPFKPGTQIVGATKSTFFTLGKTLIHSFGVASNGAIESQKSQIGYLNYSGSACGGGTAGIGSAELDHSGQYVYTLLQNGGDGSCAAYQTFKVNSDGSFTFEGDSEKSMTTSTSDGVSVPSILGSETFGYANEWVGHYSDLVGFRRESTGTLQVMQFNETDPTLSGSNYLPANPDADPTGNYVVVQLYPNNGGGDSNPPQIASYTVDSSGNLSTTNTTSNMPTTQLVGPGSTFSPDGTMLALYSSEGGGDGIEIYNFNGASPLTLNTRLLNGTPIDQVAWDSVHHLYAFSRAEGKLWVFNVSTGTTSSATMTALVSVASPFSMVVVSQSSTGGGGGGGGSCAAPSSDGVNVCTPDENATVTSPVAVEAAATVSGGVYRFELWNGSTKLASSDNGTLDQSVSLAPGTYHLIFVARNSSGTREYAYRDITVSGGGASCTAPSSDGINVCTPAENATVASPVQIDAAATVSGGVYRFEVWNGNTKLWSQDNGTIDHAISLARGTYHLTFVARNSSATHVYATRDITVGSGGAAAQYSAPLIGESTTINGSVSIDTAGNTTVAMTGGTASNSYKVQFCPAFVEGEYSQPSCFDVTTVATNSSGSGSSTVKFPQSGDWAGDFWVYDSGGKLAAETGLEPTSTIEKFMAVLLEETKTNSGVVVRNGSANPTQDPLSSGSVSYANGTISFTVMGAAPNTDYGVIESGGIYLGSSSSYLFNETLNTDGLGNGSLSVNLASEGTVGGDMFQVDYQPQPGDTHGRAGFIGGFMIP